MYGSVLFIGWRVGDVTLLGNLVSASLIRIDPERVKDILKINFPRSKKDVQSFIEKNNFLHWFLPNFDETIK